MPFVLPEFHPPDFSSPAFREAPRAVFAAAPADGVVPDNFHATSNHPEFVHLETGWKLVPESRMDAVIVRDPQNDLTVVEARRVRAGDLVALGRSESGQDGIFVHTEGFSVDAAHGDKFGFRSRGTRETPFSRSYDDLYDLLRYEREHGYIVWVAGPAVVFDKDSRDSFRELIEAGYCHALLAGNAVATHDLEAGYFGTGLGQDVYSRTLVPGGHYHHLDVLNLIRKHGSIAAALERVPSSAGVMSACLNKGVPFVLAGSIRDDGPLPEVVSDVYRAQDAMREHARRATTVITLATQLHSIAFGNMVPNYRVTREGVVRPVYLTVVDITEFSADKLANRGSAQAMPIVTNVQDFMINLRFALVGGRGA